MAFDESNFEEVRKFMVILTNLNSFITQIPKGAKQQINAEDKWILSKYNELIGNVRKSYEEYDFGGLATKLEQFLVQDFSRKYIQMIRDRAENARETLQEIYSGLVIMLAPIIPFTSEHIWQKLRENDIVKEESAHLSSFPEYNKKGIDKELQESFDSLLKVIELGLSERDKLKIGLRWPLASATIQSEKKIDKELHGIIMQQLNVKKVVANKGELKIEYDTKMNKELESEGYAREISRKIQAERKKRGMTKEQKIKLTLFADKKMIEFLEMQKEFLSERVNSSKTELKHEKAPEGALDCSVKETQIHATFS
jgi:isoleucyl-tRNA synthetase